MKYLIRIKYFKQKRAHQMKTMYDLIIKCNKTGIEEVLAGPSYSSEKINNEKDVYSRHLFSGAALVVVERDEKIRPLSVMDEINLNDNRPNPFDANLKSSKSSALFIPKDETDIKDAAWLLITNHKEKEKEHVVKWLHSIAKDAYNNNKHIIPHVDLIGSFWHKGFVNSLFSKSYALYEMHEVYEWIDIIGSKYDTTLIASLIKPIYGYYGGIYKNGFFPNDVKNLCEYCSQLFNVSKYDVAKHFTKCDIPECNDHSPSNDTKVGALIRAGDIYAELGDVQRANEHYVRAISIVDDKRWQLRLINEREKLNAYVEANGTSILFTS